MAVPARHVLIVDDDPDDRDLFIDAIREVDDSVTCQTAESGDQALQLLQDALSLPDIIVLDLRMPRLGGKPCLMAIKKNPRWKDIPVFIYTTSKNVEESVELSAMGACHFMTKPTNADDIYYLASFILGEQWITRTN